MKITVLNGSPRNKNTAKLTAAFKSGAETKGHEVTEFKLSKMNISPCIACEFCHGKGNGICAIKDDFAEVRAEIEASDMIVFASPIYYFNITGQLQCTISRFYAAGNNFVKKSALIMSSASPDVYDAAKAQYKDLLNWYKCEDKGVFSYIGDIADGDKALEEMNNFGSSL